MLLRTSILGFDFLAFGFGGLFGEADDCFSIAVVLQRYTFSSILIAVPSLPVPIAVICLGLMILSFFFSSYSILVMLREGPSSVSVTRLGFDLNIARMPSV